MMLAAPSASWAPVRIDGHARRSRFVICCDHAFNTVPLHINDRSLVVSTTDMSRHLAYDIGPADAATHLADALSVPLVMSNFSRLVVDPNRGEDDPTLVMKLYGGTIVPSNRHVSRNDIETRLDLCYRLYHDALAGLAERQKNSIIISIHSFTHQLKARAPRRWHIGLLFAQDDRFSLPLGAAIRETEPWCVDNNAPYSGALAGDTIDKHAIAHVRHNTLIQIRSDLIDTPAGQLEWGCRLAHVIPGALGAA